MILTKSVSRLYCVEKTKTAGAVGKVPYKKPKVLRSRVSLELEPGWRRLTTSLVTKGKTNLKFKKKKIILLIHLKIFKK